MLFIEWGELKPKRGVDMDFQNHDKRMEEYKNEMLKQYKRSRNYISPTSQGRQKAVAKKQQEQTNSDVAVKPVTVGSQGKNHQNMRFRGQEHPVVLTSVWPHCENDEHSQSADPGTKQEDAKEKEKPLENYQANQNSGTKPLSSTLGKSVAVMAMDTDAIIPLAARQENGMDESVQSAAVNSSFSMSENHENLQQIRTHIKSMEMEEEPGRGSNFELSAEEGVGSLNNSPRGIMEQMQPGESSQEMQRQQQTLQNGETNRQENQQQMPEQESISPEVNRIEEEQEILQPEEPTDDTMQDYYNRNTHRGFLRLQVTSGQGAVPIEGVEGIISKTVQDREYIIGRLMTNSSGVSKIIALPAPNRSLSEQPRSASMQELPYATYDLSASVDNFVPVLIKDIPIFDGIVSIQPIALQPLLASEQTAPPEIIQESEPNL